MKYLILLSLLFSHGLNASDLNLRKEVLEIVPKEISALLESKENFQQIEGRFKDKIKSTKKDKALFLKYFSNDNDVTLGFKDKKINYVYVKFSNEKNSKFFAKVIDSLSKEQLQKVKDESLNKGHEGGREIIVNLPEQSMKLIFKNNETKQLSSVFVWREGEVAP